MFYEDKRLRVNNARQSEILAMKQVFDSKQTKSTAVERCVAQQARSDTATTTTTL